MIATRLGSVLRRLMPRFSLRTLMVFMGLVGAGYALWAHWEPWSHEIMLDPPVNAYSFADFRFNYDGDRLIAWTNVIHNEGKAAAFQLMSWDCRDWQQLYFASVSASEDHINQISIVDQNCPLANEDLKAIGRLRVFTDGWQYARSVPVRARMGEYNIIMVQRIHHPEQWHGVFWLSEFYLAVFCAIALAWSTRKDLRAFGLQSAPQRPSTHE